MVKNNVFFALGSNVDDREEFILSAIFYLRKICKIIKISNIYESKAWGNTNQASFLNFCIKATTNLTPIELLNAVKEIEIKVGRIKREHWGPREIDIDILFYNDLIIEQKDLNIPHPYIIERSFFLKPLADLEPNFIHPKNGKLIKELNSRVSDKDLTLYNPLFKKLHLESSTLVMGIINLTKDSFSNDGLLSETNYEKVLIEKLEKQLNEGATIIDIGAESTKPGFEQISIESEIEIITNAIKIIRAKSKCLISVDTRNSKTAKIALNSGADMINSVAGRFDQQMFTVVKEYNCPFVLMHNSSDRAVVSKDHFSISSHTDIIKEVFTELELLVGQALNFGINKNNLIIDPGIGFGKTVKENLELINKLEVFNRLKLPILFGASRKSFIGKTLNLEVNERLYPSIAVQTIAQIKGARIIRTHDVKATREATQMTDKILSK